MEVILLERIRNIGSLGDVVTVKPGFARNFLVPKGKAVYANKSNREKFEARRAELEKIAAERHQSAVKRKEAIDKLGAITITAKSSEEGKLFGSIGVKEICDALEAAGQTVEKKEVSLSEGVLRNIGEYEVRIELEADVSSTVKLMVVGEE